MRPLANTSDPNARMKAGQDEQPMDAYRLAAIAAGCSQFDGKDDVTQFLQMIDQKKASHGLNDRETACLARVLLTSGSTAYQWYNGKHLLASHNPKGPRNLRALTSWGWTNAQPGLRSRLNAAFGGRRGQHNLDSSDEEPSDQTPTDRCGYCHIRGHRLQVCRTRIKHSKDKRRTKTSRHPHVAPAPRRGRRRGAAATIAPPQLTRNDLVRQARQVMAIDRLRQPVAWEVLIPPFRDRHLARIKEAAAVRAQSAPPEARNDKVVRNEARIERRAEDRRNNAFQAASQAAMQGQQRWTQPMSNYALQQRINQANMSPLMSSKPRVGEAPGSNKGGPRAQYLSTPDTRNLVEHHVMERTRRGTQPEQQQLQPCSYCGIDQHTAEKCFYRLGDVANGKVLSQHENYPVHKNSTTKRPCKYCFVIGHVKLSCPKRRDDTSKKIFRKHVAIRDDRAGEGGVGNAPLRPHQTKRPGVIETCEDTPGVLPHNTQVRQRAKPRSGRRKPTAATTETASRSHSQPKRPSRHHDATIDTEQLKWQQAGARPKQTTGKEWGAFSKNTSNRDKRRTFASPRGDAVDHPSPEVNNVKAYTKSLPRYSGPATKNWDKSYNAVKWQGHTQKGPVAHPCGPATSRKVDGKAITEHRIPASARKNRPPAGTHNLVTHNPDEQPPTGCQLNTHNHEAKSRTHRRHRQKEYLWLRPRATIVRCVASAAAELSGKQSQPQTSQITQVINAQTTQVMKPQQAQKRVKVRLAARQGHASMQVLPSKDVKKEPTDRLSGPAGQTSPEGGAGPRRESIHGQKGTTPRTRTCRKRGKRGRGHRKAEQ